MAMPQPRRQARSSPPWEVLRLISEFVGDPKSLAVACCVSKSWHAVFTSDHLWTPLCRSLFPSSTHNATAAAVSSRHLFQLLHTAASRRRRTRSQLLLHLPRLIFFLDVFQRGAPVLSLARAGSELVSHRGVFRFEVPMNGEEPAALDSGDDVRVAWTVVTAEWREAFGLMEFEGQARAVGNREMWFSEKLPYPSAFCCSEAEAGFEAQIFIELADEVHGGGRTVEKVSFGLMNTKTWRYVKEEDGLLYLQYFLMDTK
ncbi:probable F-box protein At5g04010 [Zingiber officinale]|uniref:F-box protein n=1 Tax=Zingiber officinale TaxID=94328 RepID=A0A8J5GQ96_ZINOF|nr:probable F-box protein At5g04010 [Zingiber officinale]KAG6504988.1 hypothetical protein ZIOFF_037336 [Zingiber officinale]